MSFFSIIIPTFNVSDTILNALKSIKSQRFKNIEVIIMDGGSSDGTGDLATRFLEESRLQYKVISEPDKGIYDAMNKGINVAKGTWLYFMGADDCLASDSVLTTISEYVTIRACDLVHGNVIGEHSGQRYTALNLLDILSKGIHHQSIFYGSHLFKQQGKYELKFQIASDYHFTIKIFSNPAFKTEYINLIIAHFGENGLSSKVYDYCFYSYHYRFLSVVGAQHKIDNPTALLHSSIYACLYLAKAKSNLVFAWKNLMFYLAEPASGDMRYRIKTFFNMLFWTLNLHRS